MKIAVEPKGAFLAFFCLSIIIMLTLLVYWPGLCGPFLMDDFHNLRSIGYGGGITDAEALARFVLTNNSGVLGRPVSMLSFALDDQYWPAPSCSFKYTNLMIHLLCGMLVILLSLKLSHVLGVSSRRALWIALFTGAIWLLHPLNVSTTLYVIQRMTQLVTLFTLAGVYCYCLGIEKLGSNQKRGFALMTLGLCFFGLLALLSKENGVLLLALIPLIRYTFFLKYATSVAEKWWNSIFLVIPALIVICYFVFIWQGMSGYDGRVFTLSERLLTEARILLEYLYLILLPTNSGTGLIHDDYVISTGLLSPPQTLLAVGALSALLVSAFAFRKKYPVYTFAMLWFFAGHLLESTFIPLELYFEHRNYLPMFGPLYSLCYAVSTINLNTKKQLILGLRKAVLPVYVLFCAVLTWQSSIIWGSSDRLFKVWATEKTSSARAQKVYAANRVSRDEPEVAIEVLLAAKQHHPNDISLDIRALEYACEYKIAPGGVRQRLIGDIGSAEFSDTLYSSLEGLVGEVLKGCPYFDVAELNSLIEQIETLPSLQTNHSYLAKVLRLHAEIFIYQRQLDAAMHLLDESFAISQSLDTAFKQAILLATAGLYDSALQYLTLAKELDGNRRFLSPSRMTELERFESFLLTNKKRASSGN